MRLRFLRTKGFTLIELLVVVAIIGILASVVLASLNSARVKARDVTRKSDMHTLEVALQSYYNDNNGTYPSVCEDTKSGDWSVSFKTSLVPYITKLPIDPANNATHYYAFCKVGWIPSTNPCYNQYVVYTNLEGGGTSLDVCFNSLYWYSRLLGS